MNHGKFLGPSKKKVVLWIHNDLLRYNTLEIIVTKNCQSSGRSPKGGWYVDTKIIVAKVHISGEIGHSATTYSEVSKLSHIEWYTAMGIGVTNVQVP